jgi:hypothetical protein
MFGASLGPPAVDDLEICPRKAPAKQDGYKHLFVCVGH